MCLVTQKYTRQASPQSFMPLGNPLHHGILSYSNLFQRMRNIGIPIGFSPVPPQQTMHGKQSLVQGKKGGEGRKTKQKHSFV